MNPIIKITIYTANEITDPIESIVYDIFSAKSIKEIFKTETIIESGVRAGLYRSDTKSVAQLIKLFKYFEELVGLYGTELFNEITQTKEVSEYATLNDGLIYYLKINQTNKLKIEIVKYTKKMMIHEKIPGVRINNPVIRYE